MQIVFTTAYSEYAVDAFRVDAVDYLVKPITSKMIDSIAHKLEKIKRLLTLQNAQSDRPDMKVQCFGSFKTTNQEGEIVKWPTRKTEEMFAFFLVKEAQIVSKWIIADELWPDLDGKRAIHNVYNTVYRLKKTIEEFSLPLTIKVMNEGYILERDGEMDVDLYKFRSMSSQTGLTMDELEQMNNLYIGPLFNDKDYAWSIHLKESLEVLYLKNSKYKK
ncbi:putative two-component response-regulatory protein YehT [compost metagenome]